MNHFADRIGHGLTPTHYYNPSYFLTYSSPFKINNNRAKKKLGSVSQSNRQRIKQRGFKKKCLPILSVDRREPGWKAIRLAQPDL